MAFVHLPDQRSGVARLSDTLNATLFPSLLSAAKQIHENKQLERENEALSEAGYQIPKEVRNQKIREALLENQVKSKSSAVNQLASQESAEAIGKAFGPEAQAIYPHLTEGGKTKLTQTLLEGKMRGIDTRQLLGSFIENNPQDISTEEDAELESMSSRASEQSLASKESPGREFPKYKLETSGMLPKERVAYQKELRSYNDPVLKEANTAKKAAEKSLKSYQALAKISPKIPQGLSRFFYDKEGNIRPLAQVLQLVPPEAEEYVKIINDFTTQAKDSYGSRVTNFDLQQFMRRLPTLANSETGRELILKRMQLTSQADAIFHQTMEDVYRKYGAGNITPEDAFKIAEDVSEKRLSRLQQEAEETDAKINALTGNNRSQLPDAASNQGKIIRNSETSQRLRSDGTNWIPI